MFRLTQKFRLHWAFRAVHGTVLAAFLALTVLPSPAMAQSITPGVILPPPGAMVGLSPAFVPATIKGIKLHPDNPMRFDFIIDTGDSNLADQALQDETNKLIKYFLASLTVPEDDLWVNLSPYEKDRIIPNEFGTTEMGRDLLAQDYLLKQITSSLIYPDSDLGKKFWDRVYVKAKEKYGTIDIPVNTFNKVWVMPDKARIYKHDNAAFVVGAHLKVMLEEDYVALQKSPAHQVTKSPAATGDPVAGDLVTEIIKDIIIPELEKEVNEGKNFAQLRQVYHSLILATWFKRNLKENLLSKVYVGQNKVEGVDIEDKDAKQKIYDTYLEAYKKGVYNFIKEEYDPAAEEAIPRKYFSGGVHFAKATSAVIDETASAGEVGFKSRAMMATADFMRSDMPAPSDRAMTGEESYFGQGKDKTLNLAAAFRKLPKSWKPKIARGEFRASGKIGKRAIDLELFVGGKEKTSSFKLVINRLDRGPNRIDPELKIEWGRQPERKVLTVYFDYEMTDKSPEDKTIARLSEMNVLQNPVVDIVYDSKKSILLIVLEDHYVDLIPETALRSDPELTEKLKWRVISKSDWLGKEAVTKHSPEDLLIMWMEIVHPGARNWIATSHTAARDGAKYLRDIYKILSDPQHKLYPAMIRQMERFFPAEESTKFLPKMMAHVDREIKTAERAWKGSQLDLVKAERFDQLAEEMEKEIVTSWEKNAAGEQEQTETQAAAAQQEIEESMEEISGLLDEFGQLKKEKGELTPEEKKTAVKQQYAEISRKVAALKTLKMPRGRLSGMVELEGLIARFIDLTVEEMEEDLSVPDFLPEDLGKDDLPRQGTDRAMTGIDDARIVGEIEAPKDRAMLSSALLTLGMIVNGSTGNFNEPDWNLQLLVPSLQQVQDPASSPQNDPIEQKARKALQQYLKDITDGKAPIPNTEDMDYWKEMLDAHKADLVFAQDLLSNEDVLERFIVMFFELFAEAHDVTKITYVNAPKNIAEMKLKIDDTKWQSMTWLDEKPGTRKLRRFFQNAWTNFIVAAADQADDLPQVRKRLIEAARAIDPKMVEIMGEVERVSAALSDGAKVEALFDKWKKFNETFLIPAGFYGTLNVFTENVGQPTEESRYSAVIFKVDRTENRKIQGDHEIKVVYGAKIDRTNIILDAFGHSIPGERVIFINSEMIASQFKQIKKVLAGEHQLLVRGYEYSPELDELVRSLYKGKTDAEIVRMLELSTLHHEITHKAQELNGIDCALEDHFGLSDEQWERMGVDFRESVNTELAAYLGEMITSENPSTVLLHLMLHFLSGGVSLEHFVVARYLFNTLDGRKKEDWLDWGNAREVVGLFLKLSEKPELLRERAEALYEKAYPGLNVVDRAMLANQATQILALTALAMCGAACAVAPNRLVIPDYVRQTVKPVVPIPVPGGNIFLMGQLHSPAALVMEFGQRLRAGQLDKEFVDQFLESIQPIITAYQGDISKIKTMLADPSHAIKAIGLEYSPQEMENIFNNIGLLKINLQIVLRSLGYSDDTVDQIALALEGPVLYLYMNNDPALQGIRLVGVEDAKSKNASLEQLMLITSKVSQLISAAQDKGISAKAIKDWFLKVNEQLRFRSEALTEQEMNQMAGSSWVDKELSVQAKDIIAGIIAANKTVEDRDPLTAVNAVAAQEKFGSGLLVLIGASHVPPLQRSIEQIFQAGAPVRDRAMMSLRAGEKAEIPFDQLRRTNSRVTVAWGGYRPLDIAPSTSFSAAPSLTVEGGLNIANFKIEGKRYQVMPRDSMENIGGLGGIIRLPSGGFFDIYFSTSRGQYFFAVGTEIYSTKNGELGNFIEFDPKQELPDDAVLMRSVRVENGNVVVEASANVNSVTVVETATQIAPLTSTVTLGARSSTKETKFKYTGPVRIDLPDAVSLVLVKQWDGFSLVLATDKNRRINLQPGIDFTFGRGYPDNPFGIGAQTPQISSRHFIIRVEDEAQGIIFLEDIRSTNGTTVVPEGVSDSAMMARRDKKEDPELDPGTLWARIRNSWQRGPGVPVNMTDANRAKVEALERLVAGDGFEVVGGLARPDHYRLLKRYTGSGLLATRKGVYSPTRDGMLTITQFLPEIEYQVSEFIPQLLQSGKKEIRILVIGAGTGVDAASAMHQAKRFGLAVDLDAIDINPAAIETAQYNFDHAYKDQLTSEDKVQVAAVRLGQEFNGLRGPYDLILFNAPNAVRQLSTEDGAVEMYESDFKRILEAMKDRLLDPAGMALVGNLRRVILPGERVIPQGLEAMLSAGEWSRAGVDIEGNTQERIFFLLKHTERARRESAAAQTRLDNMMGGDRAMMNSQEFKYFQFRVLDQLAEFQFKWETQFRRMSKLIALSLGLIPESALADESPLSDEIFMESVRRLNEFSLDKIMPAVNRSQYLHYTFAAARLRRFLSSSRFDAAALQEDLTKFKTLLGDQRIVDFIAAQREGAGVLSKLRLSIVFDLQDGRLMHVGTGFGEEIPHFQFIVDLNENGTVSRADVEPKGWADIPPNIQNMLEAYNLEVSRGTDRAMTGGAKDVGGIDFNPANLNIEAEGQNIQMNVPAVDLKMFEGPGFKGLTPFIIQIVPVTNLPLLLGTNQPKEEEKLSMR